MNNPVILIHPLDEPVLELPDHVFTIYGSKALHFITASLILAKHNHKQYSENMSVALNLHDIRVCTVYHHMRGSPVKIKHKITSIHSTRLYNVP